MGRTGPLIREEPPSTCPGLAYATNSFARMGRNGLVRRVADQMKNSHHGE
jgi:hypothetical protein